MSGQRVRKVCFLRLLDVKGCSELCGGRDVGKGRRGDVVNAIGTGKRRVMSGR